MNRRAQLTSHIIIFVIGLVVIGLVFLFGYQVIQDINNDRCDVRRLQFGTDLSRALDTNKNWGTNKVVELQAPCETTNVCFVDRRVIDDPTAQDDYLELVKADGNLTQPEQVANIINASVWTNVNQAGDPVDGSQTNVFTVQQSGQPQPVERYSTAAAPIQISSGSDPSAQCIPVQAETLRVRMQGNGRTASITNVVQGGST